MRTHYEIKIASNRKQWYFVLRAGNGEVIATSELYNTKQALRKGIRSMRFNAAIAYIEDKTV